MLGVEAVLPDGTVLDLLHTLRKDNTGRAPGLLRNDPVACGAQGQRCGAYAAQGQPWVRLTSGLHTGKPLESGSCTKRYNSTSWDCSMLWAV